MSLDFRLSDIEDYENVCWLDEDQMNPVTKALIFATMAVGLSGITEANAEEFFGRLRVVESTQGTYLVGAAPSRFITPEMVRQHIGLATNVSDESRSQWVKRVFVSKGNVVDEYIRYFRTQPVA